MILLILAVKLNADLLTEERLCGNLSELRTCGVVEHGVSAR
jgi:hypothetical protein